MKLLSDNNARHDSRSLLYGDIKLAIHTRPASANNLATSLAQWLKLNVRSKKLENINQQHKHDHTSIIFLSVHETSLDLHIKSCGLKETHTDSPYILYTIFSFKAKILVQTMS
jgi:hypothetical protein